jgi:hypothetical protein
MVSYMPIMIQGKKYYTISEAAKLLNKSRWTIHRWLTDPTRLNGHGQIDAQRDMFNRRAYIAAASLPHLKDRFEPLGLQHAGRKRRVGR